MEKEISKMFLNTQFKIIDEDMKKEQHTLQVNVNMSGDKVLLSMASLASYFQEQIIEAAKEKWPKKKVFVSYLSEIPLDYLSFRAFKTVVYD